MKTQASTRTTAIRQVILPTGLVGERGAPFSRSLPSTKRRKDVIIGRGITPAAVTMWRGEQPKDVSQTIPYRVNTRLTLYPLSTRKLPRRR